MSIPINPNQSPCSMMCHRHWKEAGWSALRGTPGLFISAGVSRKNLGFANSEHFGATGWTCTLGSGSLILHSDSLGILHFLLGLTFHTVCLHVFTSFLLRTINYSLHHVNGKRYLTQRSHSLEMWHRLENTLSRVFSVHRNSLKRFFPRDRNWRSGNL